MKTRLVIAAGIAAISIALYPLMQHLSYLERGRHAIGGEEMLLVGGLFAALFVILDGLQKRSLVAAQQKGDRQETDAYTESEQSDEHYHFDA